MEAQTCCPVIQDVEQDIATWSRLTMAANDDQRQDRRSEGPAVSTIFLYRRALSMALRGVADWIHLAPDRALGMAIVSYQNLADYHGRRFRPDLQLKSLREAYDLVASHVLYVGTPKSVRVVAVTYLEIVFSDLARLYEETERLDELEELLQDYDYAIDFAKAR